MVMVDNWKVKAVSLFVNFIKDIGLAIFDQTY